MPPAADDRSRPGLAPGTGYDGGDPPGVVAFAARALGSALRLSVHLGEPAGGERDSRGVAEAAWAEVRAEFDAVDAALSRFRADSELTALNRRAGTGLVVRVSGRLRRALAAIDRARRLTDGRFDASVLGALERIGEHGADPGDPGGLGSAALLEGWPVHVPPVPVDLGGIGKGLALRWARDRALAALPAGAGVLLDAGGDLVAGGCPPGDGWQIGIEDPAAPDPGSADPLVVVAVETGAVATSSVRVRNWVGPDGAPVHHLVDPLTGDPARTGLVAVTVAGPDPAWAEVWSKALFLAGRDRIGGEARARGLAAWWVDETGRLGMTPAARVRTAWVAESRVG